MIKTVIKSNGERVEFEPERLNKAALFGDLDGSLWSGIALEASRLLFDGCTTQDVQQAMIKACVNRFDEKYLKMASRLQVGSIYKRVFGGFSRIPKFADYVTQMSESGRWAKMDYDLIELNKLSMIIDHSKDLNYEYAVLRQFEDKYAIRDKVNNRLYESPQMMFMGIAMAVMEKMPRERRLNDIAKLYEYLSELKINAPTPYLNGLRTGSTGYASCCVIKADDTAPSIGAAREIAYTMTCKQAGIGYYLESRSIGDSVRQGTVSHMGKVGYYRGIDAGVKENRQSTRGGSATVSYTVLDPEINDLLVLKNPTTVPSKRINTLDYSVGLNSAFVRRAAQNKPWYLISYHDAPELYEAIYRATEEEFEALLEATIASGVKYEEVSARSLAIEILTQRAETGRLYIYWCDSLNNHTPFKDTIYSSNLCQEIALPTKGFTEVRNLFNDDEEGADGEIALCFLSSIVAGRVTKEEYEDVAYYTVLMIDNVMDIMDYPYESLSNSSRSRRSIGVGLTNLAHYLASNEAKYSSKKGKQLVHDLAEMHSFYLHKASLRLAQEREPAAWMHKTKYPEGWLPIDDYTLRVDSLIDDPSLKMDWEPLRKEIIKTGGIRHSVLEAYMPNESSSLATYTTNGLYPIRDIKVAKKSPQGVIPFIAPEYEKFKEFYELAWDIDTKDMIEVYALIQKFTGQAISSDFYHDYTKPGKDKISIKEYMMNLILATNLGLKTHYYLNSKTEESSLTSDLTSQEAPEDECDACKL